MSNREKKIKYSFEHRVKLEEMRRHAMTLCPVQTAYTKMYLTCECGAYVCIKNIIQHYCSTKHREKCGDIKT